MNLWKNDLVLFYCLNNVSVVLLFFLETLKKLLLANIWTNNLSIVGLLIYFRNLEKIVTHKHLDK